MSGVVGRQRRSMCVHIERIISDIKGKGFSEKGCWCLIASAAEKTNGTNKVMAAFTIRWASSKWAMRSKATAWQRQMSGQFQLCAFWMVGWHLWIKNLPHKCACRFGSQKKKKKNNHSKILCHSVWVSTKICSYSPFKEKAINQKWAKSWYRWCVDTEACSFFFFYYSVFKNTKTMPLDRNTPTGSVCADKMQSASASVMCSDIHATFDGHRKPIVHP